MSFSEFSQDDLNLIARERDALFELAGARCRDDRELETVKKAFEFANEAHLNVRRRSGEPFIIHPVKVAEIVVEEVGLGFKSICAALLHDVVEDTEYSADDIRNLFGDKIGALVDGLTKIRTVLNNEEQKGGAVISESLQAENFKRILLTMNDDVRVVLIKLCDRLHNCRTIEYLPEHKRDRVLSETMFIFIPLAHRLGLYEIKSEMENIWLKYKEPDEYNAISRKINTDVDVRNHEIDEFISPIRDALLEYGYKFEIRKRIKTPYSIWYKIHNKQVPFEQIYDLYAVRIIFDPAEETMQAERSQAYLIYSVVTNLYRENLSRRRDWISQPKSNGYEALHCTLMSHVGVWIEVQIRSRRMNDIAEKGIAAHWAYKNDGYITENDSEMDKWLAEVQDILGSKDVGDMEILDLIHSDLVSSEIVVFTPKGEQKSIKYGSTALDFAYMIHSHIGEKAIAAKVNMKLVPLSHVLKSGDQVEIITAESAKPKIECLQFLTTRYAKSRVIDYFRKDYDVISSNGEKIFMERMKAMGVSAGNDILKKFINYSKINDLGELYFRVGLGILGPEEFRTILTEDALQLPVGASDKLEYVMADCCNPIPGDSIVGFMSGENTIIVHKKTCPVAENLASKFGNRVVVPQWMLLTKEYPIRLSLRGIDRVGILSDISFFISGSQGSNIRKIQLSTEEGLFDGYIELLVRDKKNLDSMVAGLKKIDGIQDVVRTDI